MKIYIKANDDFDYGYGFDSNGEAIDESTVDEMYRIACEIVDTSELAEFGVCDIADDSFKYYATGLAWGAALSYTIMFETSSDKIDLRYYYAQTDDHIMFPDLIRYGEVRMRFDIYVRNGDEIQVELTEVDVYENGRYTEDYDDAFYKLFDTDKLCEYVKRLAEPTVYEIHSTLSNI